MVNITHRMHSLLTWQFVPIVLRKLASFQSTARFLTALCGCTDISPNPPHTSSPPTPPMGMMVLENVIRQETRDKNDILSTLF